MAYITTCFSKIVALPFWLGFRAACRAEPTGEKEREPNDQRVPIVRLPSLSCC